MDALLQQKLSFSFLDVDRLLFNTSGLITDVGRKRKVWNTAIMQEQARSMNLLSNVRSLLTIKSNFIDEHLAEIEQGEGEPPVEFTKANEILAESRQTQSVLATLQDESQTWKKDIGQMNKKNREADDVISNLEAMLGRNNHKLNNMKYDSCPNEKSYRDCTHYDLKKKFDKKVRNLRKSIDEQWKSLRDWKSRKADVEAEIESDMDNYTKHQSRVCARDALTELQRIARRFIILRVNLICREFPICPCLRGHVI